MKRIVTFLFLSATFFGNSQVILVDLDHNNVRTRVHSNGALGYNPSAFQAVYEVPKGSGRNALYVVSPTYTATLDSGQLIGNYSEYAPNAGGYLGPVVNDYSDPWSFQNSMLFYMHDSVVTNHLNNWTNSGYVPTQPIENWPSFGNNALNSSPYLAPFYDANNDSVYTPEDGDYPFHFGEEGYYSTYNYDTIVNPIIMNNETRPIEVNYSAYQFNHSGLENVTFMMHRVTNKSNETLQDFQWGLFADFDLGNINDDFIGTNVDRNLCYAYNSTDNDASGGGNVGYGNHPPAIGIVSLSKSLYATNKISYGGNHDINTLVNLRQNMTGRNSFGQMNLDSQGDPTFFLYPGDPNDTGSESQYQLGDVGADQRAMMSVRPLDLAPGESKCYHFAIVFADSETSHLESVTELFQVTDLVQAYFDDSIDYDCSMVMTSDIASTEDHEAIELNLFPNPTNGNLYLNSNERINSVKIYSMDGRVHSSKLQELQSAQYAIDMSGLSEGVYSVQFLFKNGKVLNRKVVRK